MNSSELQIQITEDLSPNHPMYGIPDPDIKHDIRKFEKTKWTEKEVSLLRSDSGTDLLGRHSSQGSGHPRREELEADRYLPPWQDRGAVSAPVDEGPGPAADQGTLERRGGPQGHGARRSARGEEVVPHRSESARQDREAMQVPVPRSSLPMTVS